MTGSPELAAELNQHTTTKMVRDIYDVQREHRNFERIKGLTNNFVPIEKEISELKAI
jgi:hypothetical protein